jgi:O-methyltransferase
MIKPQLIESEAITPWCDDKVFKSTYAQICENTLVLEYKLYELWQLVEQCSKLKYGSIIEIGTYRGGSGTLIAKQAKNCNIKEKVYLCDTFIGTVKKSEKDSVMRDGLWADTSIEVISDLLNKVDLDNVVILSGIFPDETGKQVENEQFRFCHIDVDMYQSAYDIDKWIWPRLVPGGIIVYDDYGSRECDGILTYVEEQRMLSDRLLIYNLNGHAIIIKLN